MKNVSIFVSGGGTNLQALIDAVSGKVIPARIAAVIASNGTCFATERARRADIPVYVYNKSDYKTAEARDANILKTLKKHKTDYVILAGYLSFITDVIVKKYPYKIINLHPSLLPAYGGKGCWGLNVHRAVLANKEPFSGATVHFVNSEYDKGAVILQEKLAVSPSDTPESLSERITETIEHNLLVKAVKALVEGRITVENNKVKIEEEQT